MRHGRFMASSLFAVAFTVTLLAGVTDVSAARWRTLATTADNGEVCLSVGGQSLSYKRLEIDDPVVVRIRGPRRVKILTRHLFAAGETGRSAFTLHVAMDGEAVLSKVFQGTPREDVVRCDDADAQAGGLHRAYVTVPAGWHELEITAAEAAVAARIFRETKRQREDLVTYAPEHYSGVTQLQFESGSRSTYYSFSPDHPLTCEVTGPTTLTVWTRLDFDHTMNGSQPYTLDVFCDGEPWRIFHYDTKKLDAAVYMDRPGVLPGERKTLKIPLGKGRHRVEIRCVRPSGCCVTAKIRIPAKDVR